ASIRTAGRWPRPGPRRRAPYSGRRRSRPVPGRPAPTWSGSATKPRPPARPPRTTCCAGWSSASAPSGRRTSSAGAGGRRPRPRPPPPDGPLPGRGDLRSETVQALPPPDARILREWPADLLLPRALSPDGRFALHIGGDLPRKKLALRTLEIPAGREERTE